MTRTRALLACLLILSIVGCGGRSPTTTPPTVSPETPTETPNPVDAPVILQATPNTISFPGTSEASFAITASGAWQIEADQPWLSATPASGTGNATVAVKVDRNGVAPNHYEGTLLLKSAEVREVMSVYMRFPTFQGNLFSPTGQLEAARLHTKTVRDVATMPGEVLVKLEPRALAEQAGIDILGVSEGITLAVQAHRDGIAALAEDYSLEVLEGLSPELPIFKLETQGQDVESVLSTLRRDGRIAYAEANRKVQTASMPNDPHLPYQWHYDNINLAGAWDLTEGSSEIIVAVVDSGVDPDHPDLQGQLVPGYDFLRNTTQMVDLDGHGTHVSGTIAAASNNGQGVTGIAWRSKVMPVRTLSNVEDDGDEYSIYRGVLFAAGLCVFNSEGATVCPKQAAKVINLSVSSYNLGDCRGSIPSFVAQDALAQANEQGATLVAAAGNENCGLVSFPASDPSVIAVSATGPYDAVTHYSNYGSEIWVAAPGGNTTMYGLGYGVLSTTLGGGYEFMQGTSMAAPHVSGIAALILAANPKLNPVDVRLILQLTAKDLFTDGWDAYYGHGLVDAEAAVRLARSTLSAQNSDFTVRLFRAGQVIREVQADASGNFSLKNLLSGSYTLEAGNDRNGNGVLGDPGEFYGITSVNLSYSGDRSAVGLSVQAK